MTASPVTTYPEPTPAERRAWYFKKQADRRRAAFRFEVGRISSFGLLREMLETATPEQAVVINERIEERRAHRNATHRKQKARLRAAAEAEQDERIGHA